MQLPITVSGYNLLVFLEYLYNNSLSPKDIRNYLSSIKSTACRYKMNSEAADSHVIKIFLRSISINSKFSPTPRGVFDIRTMYNISIACDSLHDPILYRAIFLVSFFAFLRISNVAPHSPRQFDRFVQTSFLAPPGAHLIIKFQFQFNFYSA